MRWIDPERVDFVNEIVKRTGAEVFLSSSTRSDPRMSVVLAQAGLRPKIRGVTPILQWEVVSGSGGLDYRAYTRVDEIREVLLQYHPDSFVVLDDMDLDWGELGNFPPFLVKTDFETGLLRVHVERAVRLLNL